MTRKKYNKRKYEKELQSELLLCYLEWVQKQKKVYWVQTKHLAKWFGESYNKRKFKTNKNKVHRYLQPWVELGLVEVTYRREQIGESTGKSKIKYYHSNRVEE